MTHKPIKPRKCRNRSCRKVFVPGLPLQTVCGLPCAIALIDDRKAKQRAKQEKIERKQINERRLELKPLQYWLKRAEKAVNAFVRERDKDEPCISCGTADSPEWHAGHFIPATAHATRFDPACIHKQCAKCNVFLGGNQTQYEIRLVAKIGQEEVNRLKNSPRSRKWTREECQGIEAEYKEKLNELKRNIYMGEKHD